MFEQHAQVKTQVRDIIYNQLYDRPYNYGVRDEKPTTAAGDSRFPPSPVVENEVSDAVDRPIKPYIVPTPVQNLPSVLGPPMGG